MLKHESDLSLKLQNVSSSEVLGLPFINPVDYSIYEVEDGESSSAGYVAGINLGFRLYRPVGLIWNAWLRFWSAQVH